MENKIRKHEMKIPPSMMSNPLVNAANLGPSLMAAFPLMPNDLTGVAGLCEKLDAGWPESEEGQVGNVKLEEEVKRRSNEDNLVK